MGEKKNPVDEALKLPGLKEFEERLEDYMTAEGAESGDNIIIVMLDADDFFQVNESFGREVGDNVLIGIGKHLVKNVPASGEVFRIAGDEFGIIFKGELEKEDVFLLMNDVRASYDVKTPDGVAQTISMGIATAFDDAARPQELTRKADSALYRAKVAGRNRVALAKEEKMVPKTSHYTQDQLKNLTKLSKREGIGEAILLREALDMLLKKYAI